MKVKRVIHHVKMKQNQHNKNEKKAKYKIVLQGCVHRTTQHVYKHVL